MKFLLLLIALIFVAANAQTPPEDVFASVRGVWKTSTPNFGCDHYISFRRATYLQYIVANDPVACGVHRRGVISGPFGAAITKHEGDEVEGYFMVAVAGTSLPGDDNWDKRAFLVEFHLNRATKVLKFNDPEGEWPEQVYEPAPPSCFDGIFEGVSGNAYREVLSVDRGFYEVFLNNSQTVSGGYNGYLGVIKLDTDKMGFTSHLAASPDGDIDNTTHLTSDKALGESDACTLPITLVNAAQDPPHDTTVINAERAASPLDGEYITVQDCVILLTSIRGGMIRSYLAPRSAKLNNDTCQSYFGGSVGFLDTEGDATSGTYTLHIGLSSFECVRAQSTTGTYTIDAQGTATLVQVNLCDSTRTDTTILKKQTKEGIITMTELTVGGTITASQLADLTAEVAERLQVDALNLYIFDDENAATRKRQGETKITAVTSSTSEEEAAAAQKSLLALDSIGSNSVTGSSAAVKAPGDDGDTVDASSASSLNVSLLWLTLVALALFFV